MTAPPPPDAIELRVDKIAQLFHSLDPYPFRERDLDKEAEEYIVGWARELDADQPIAIVVHMPVSEAQSKPAQDLREAFAHYFTYRAELQESELKELFREGRRSLAVGITILVICLLSAQFVARQFFEPPFRRLVEESLLILGWVANWRPLEIFVYDWWPIRRRRDLYRRLAAASVVVKPYPDKQAPVPITKPGFGNRSP
jgi:hypothetical protein